MALVAVVVAVWWASTEYFSIEPDSLTEPGQRAGARPGAMQTAPFWADLGASTLRIVVSFALAFAVAFALAATAKLAPVTASAILRVAEFIRYLPVPQFVPAVPVLCRLSP